MVSLRVRPEGEAPTLPNLQVFLFPYLTKMIKGGYYIKARKIQESEVAHFPPHVREVWEWLIQKVNHKDNGTIKRGQTVCTIQDIREGLHWKIGYRKERYKTTQCENSMKVLRRAGMIATTRTGRGVVVTVLNYELYQDPKNYESRDESRNESLVLAEQLPNHKQEGEEGKECKEDSSGDAAKKITPGQFEEFWKLYPGKKTNKGQCFSKWKTICGREGNERPAWKDIRRAIRDQKKTERWQDKKFIPLPHTWLNQRRWLDDPTEMTVSKFKQEGTKVKHAAERSRFDENTEETEIQIRP